MKSEIKAGSGILSEVKRYSYCFALFFSFCILVPAALSHNNLFPKGDGVIQQYTYFVFAGKWIRKILYSVFVDRVSGIPIWFSSAFGFDAFVSYSNLLVNPIYWISALTPEKYSEYVFDGVIALQLYLSGLSFVLLCRHFGLSSIKVSLGANIYVFSSVTLMGLMQAGYLYWFYMFPLLLIGADNLWKKNKHLMYTLVIAYITMSSWYTTYVFVLFICVYCIVSFCFDEDRTVKHFISLFIRFSLFTMIGIGIGIGIKIPELMNTITSDRLSSPIYISVFANPAVLKKFFLGMFSPECITPADSFSGISSALFPAGLVFFCSKGNRKIKTFFILYCLSVFFPVIGSFMNGMNYVSYRYLIAFPLLMSYIFVISFDDLERLPLKKTIVIASMSLVYLILIVLIDIDYIISGISVIIFMGFILIAKHFKIKNIIFRILPVLFSCIIICGLFWMERADSEMIDMGKGYYELTESEGRQYISELNMPSDNRYDYIFNYYDMYTQKANSSMILDINGFDYYCSTYNNYVSNYYDELAISGDQRCFLFSGPRGRNFIERLCGTKYVIIPKGLKLNIPYGYELFREYGDVDIYECTDNVSIMYMYDDTVSYSRFDLLDPLKKEELMMYAAVVEDNANADISRYSFSISTLPYQIEETNGLRFIDDRIVADEEGAYLMLSFEEISGKDLFLEFSNLEYIVDSVYCPGDYQITVFATYNGEPVYEDAEVLYNSASNQHHLTEENVFGFGITDRPVNGITIYFETTGSYSLNELTVFTRTKEDTASVIDAFADHACVDQINVQLDGNHIHSTVDIDEDKLLVLAVPYSQGWECYVDGQPTEIIRSNIAFMGVYIPSGEHTVEFEYHTPYVVAGFTISLVSAAVFAAITLLSKKKDIIHR